MSVLTDKTKNIINNLNLNKNDGPLSQKVVKGGFWFLGIFA